MGNWQERMKQRSEEETRKTAKREADLRRLSEEQGVRKLEAARQEPLKQEASERELREIIKRFRVEKPLEEIKREVWHVGTVEPIDVTDWGIHVGFELRFDYQGAEYDVIRTVTYHSGGRDSPFSTTHVIYGKTGHIVTRTTGLTVEVGREWTGSPILTVFDSEVSLLAARNTGYDNGKYIVYPKHPEAYQMIEGLLLQSCIERQKKAKLPLQLKAKGEQEIHNIVPWYRRLRR